MNAVIVDIRGRSAAALREDGSVVRIRNNGYMIGQQLDLHETKSSGMPRSWKRAISGVVAAAFVIVAGAGTAYAMPYGTVTLDTDTDSSLVYTINCFDYVLDVNGGNESGNSLLLEVDRHELRHHRIDRAISATVKKLGNSQGGGHPHDAFRITAEAGNSRHKEKLQKKLDGFSWSDAGHAGFPNAKDRRHSDGDHPVSGTDIGQEVRPG